MSINHPYYSTKVALFFLGIGFLLSISSCGRDADILGCTNPLSPNFNPSANVNDGSCISPIDQFTGAYTGSLDCAGRITPIVNNMNQEFVISQLLSSDTEVELQLINSPLSLPMRAVVMDDNLVFNNMDIGPFTFDTPTESISALLDATGELSFNTDNELFGPLAISITNMNTGELVINAEICVISGVRN